MGFSIMAGISVLEFAMIFVLRYFAKREAELDRREEEENRARELEKDGVSEPPRLDLKDIGEDVKEVK
jgi:hypothetical protein